MRHVMKLQKEYYNYIINGTKRIELRLNDEKRSLIKVGDTIIFKKEPNLDEQFEVKVIDLLKYNTFEELINKYNIEELADKSISKEELLRALETFYPKEKQKKYKVLGIKIELK